MQWTEESSIVMRSGDAVAARSIDSIRRIEAVDWPPKVVRDSSIESTSRPVGGQRPVVRRPRSATPKMILRFSHDSFSNAQSIVAVRDGQGGQGGQTRR